MKIKFDFLKSDEKDRLKLKKIDSKDILYIEIFENSLLFKFVKGKEFKIYLNIKNYDRKLKKNNSFLEGYTKNGTKNNDASLTKEIRNKLEKKQKILNRLEVIYNFNDDEIEKDLKEMVEELLEI